MTNVTQLNSQLPYVPEGDGKSPGQRAAEKLLKDLQAESPVEPRTIIGWTSVHPVNGVEFDYAAIFAGGMWYTTVGRDNQNVQKIMSHADLLAYLTDKKRNTHNLRVAVDFLTLNW